MSAPQSAQFCKESAQILSCGTHLDISMITNILAHYLHSAALSHVAAAKYNIKYLKGCKYLGIKFSTKENAKLSTFLNFLIMESIKATIDAN